MARWRSQDYECVGGAPELAPPNEIGGPCGWRDSELILIPEDAPYSEDSCPSSVECPICGGRAERRFSAPAILARAMPDGTFRGEGWQLTKEAAHLKLRRKRAKGEKAKAEITKQIDHLQKTVVSRGYKDKGRET